MGIEPTPKNPEIDQFIGYLAGISRQQAAKQNICVGCTKPHTEFRDAVSRIEANISGLCQKCQDFTFREEDE